MPSPRPRPANTSMKIRRHLAKGKSPAEVAKVTGASLGYVYAVKAKMTPPAPKPIKLEVPLIPFAPIPAGIASLQDKPIEPTPQAQPIAAEAVVEMEEKKVAEKPDDYGYVWAVAGVLLLTALFLWYFTHAHRG